MHAKVNFMQVSKVLLWCVPVLHNYFQCCSYFKLATVICLIGGIFLWNFETKGVTLSRCPNFINTDYETY